MVKVTSAARPSRLSAAKRFSMRVVMLRTVHFASVSRQPNASGLAKPKRTPMPDVCAAPSSPLALQKALDRIEVLVAAAGKIDHHQVISWLLHRDFRHLGERVRGFERRDDALELAAKLKRRHRLVVGRRQKLHAAHVVQPSVLWPDAG